MFCGKSIIMNRSAENEPPTDFFAYHIDKLINISYNKAKSY